jgi:hypothetical protein
LKGSIDPSHSNPLIHRSNTDTVSATVIFMTGVLQVLDRIKDQPMTEEMHFMFDNSMRTLANALKFVRERGVCDEDG